jgi:DNA-directed RNA polymerase subunit H (RpoH/RPB5)
MEEDLLEIKCINIQSLILARKIFSTEIEIFSLIFEYIKNSDYSNPLKITNPDNTSEKIHIFLYDDIDQMDNLRKIKINENELHIINLPMKENEEWIRTQNNIFFLKEFAFNLTEHILVPKHEIFIKNKDVNRKKQFLRKHMVLETQLPVLLNSDPLSRYYDMKVGDICKITRKGRISYRIVQETEY